MKYIHLVVTLIKYTINVLKFWTLYSMICCWLNFCFLCNRYYARPQKMAMLYHPKFCMSIRRLRVRQHFHHSCPLHNWYHPRYFHQTSHKWKALWDDVQNMNCNSGLLTFGVIALWTLNIASSTMYLCLLCKSETVQDIFIKLHTNVKY